MKSAKYLRIAFYSVFLVSLLAAVLASPVMAQGAVSKWYVVNPFVGWGDITLQGVVAKIINIAMMAAGMVAVIYLIIGGFRYVTSGGNAEAIEGAKATILNAIIGLIIIFISFLLVNYILTAMGINNALNPSAL